MARTQSRSCAIDNIIKTVEKQNLDKFDQVNAINDAVKKLGLQKSSVLPPAQDIYDLLLLFDERLKKVEDHLNAAKKVDSEKKVDYTQIYRKLYELKGKRVLYANKEWNLELYSEKFILINKDNKDNKFIIRFPDTKTHYLNDYVEINDDLIAIREIN